ncbi:hypothetical protein [uncultured Amnibacterium sp.]|uniref:hypothetical protein n=1 Tax=uncultured Amnibacterium sp. TaxID=1631851 RepID=UPI0035CA9A53
MPEADADLLAHDGRLPDATLLADFTAAYRGPHDPRDALAWLFHPSSIGPSGVPSPSAQLAPLRERLYRPDVTAAERKHFDQASARVQADAQQAADALRTALARSRPLPDAEQPDPLPIAPDRTGGRRRGSTWGVVVAGLVVAVGVALVLLPRSADAPTGSASPVPRLSPLPPGVVGSAPLAFVGSAAQRRSDRQDLAALFAPGSTHTIGDYLFAHRTSLTGAIRTDSIAVDHRGRGPAVVSLLGIDGGGGPGNVSVLLTCAKPAAYSWTLTTDTPEGDRSRIGRSSGANCSGALITSSFVPAHLLIPTSITIQVPEDVDYLLEVDLSQY